MPKLKLTKKISVLSTYVAAFLLLLGVSVFGYYRFGVRADTNVSTYCFDGPNCPGTDTITVYNVNRIITNKDSFNNLKSNTGRYFINDTTMRLPMSISQTDIDDIFDHQNGKQIKAKADAWNSVVRVYNVAASGLGRDKNTFYQKFPTWSADRIKRRLSSSGASYSRNDLYFTIYNYSKFIPKQADKDALAALLNDDSGKNSLRGISIDSANDTLNLIVEVHSPVTVNSINRSAWQSLQKIYSAIKSNPDKSSTTYEGDKGYATSAYNNIAEGLRNYKPSGVYERIKENNQEYFLINGYSAWFSKDDVKKIQENQHFAGKAIQKAFIGNTIKLPVQINSESDISPDYTPLTKTIAEKSQLAYQKIISSTNQTKDKDDAGTSVQNLDTYIGNHYYMQGSCGQDTNFSFGFEDKNVVICNLASQINKKSIKLMANLAVRIKQTTGKDIAVIINTDENNARGDSATIPRVIKPEDVIIFDDNDKKGWQAVTELYRLILNRADNNQTDLKYDMANSIAVIENTVKNPPIYRLLSGENHYQLEVYKSFSACKSINRGDDRDVTIDNTYCIIGNPGDNNGKYFNPKENSKAHQLLKSVVAVAKKEDKDILQGFLDDYVSQFTGESGSGNLKITAPKVLKQTNELVSEINLSSPESTPAFQTYNNDVPVKYTVNIDESLVKQLAASGSNFKLGLATNVYSNSDHDISKVGEYIKDVKGSGEIKWNTDIGTDSSVVPHLKIGKHKFEISLFAYDSTSTFPQTRADLLDNEPTIKILDTIEHEFDIVGPNGERDPSEIPSNDPNACTGTKITINAPSAVKPQDFASISATLTSPRAKRKEDEIDAYQMYISTNPYSESMDDPASIQAWENVPDSNTKTYNANNKPSFMEKTLTYEDFPGPNRSDKAKYFIMVKTFRGVRSSDISCTGKKYKAISVTENASGSTCHEATQPDGSKKKVCDPDPDPSDPGNPGGPELPGGSSIDSLGELVDTIIKFFYIALGAIIVITIIIGGIMYISASGDNTKAEKAKKTVIYAVYAVVIAVVSYTIVHVAANEILKIIK